MTEAIHFENIETKFRHQVAICYIHADRIQMALDHVEKYLPLCIEK